MLKFEYFASPLVNDTECYIKILGQKNTLFITTK